MPRRKKVALIIVPALLFVVLALALFCFLLPRESVEIVVTLLVSAPCLKVALRARTHSSTFTRMGPSRI